MTSKFDILMQQVNGLTRMNEARSIKQQIKHFIEDQLDQGIDTFTKMDDLDKDRLCTLMSQDLGVDREYAIIDMPDLQDVVTYLLDYINSNDIIKAYDLAEKMREQLWLRFEYPIDLIFEEIKNDRIYEEYREHGLKPHVDSVNGEISWYK